MSAATTAAGYLYAAGRLRGRAVREQEQQTKPEKPTRVEIRAAIVPPREHTALAPKKAPRIEYRVRRRWSPE